MTKSSFWTLNKLIVLLALGGFFMLLMELRFEHRDALGDHWQAWIPIVYSGVMIPVTILGLWFWEKGGRKVLFWAFAAGIIIGALGIWFHDKGKPWKSISVVIAAWETPIVKHHRPAKGGNQAAPPPAATTNGVKKDEKKPEEPKPPLAPLSFAGMGLLGMLACWKKETHVL